MRRRTAPLVVGFLGMAALTFASDAPAQVALGPIGPGDTTGEALMQFRKIEPEVALGELGEKMREYHKNANRYAPQFWMLDLFWNFRGVTKPDDPNQRAKVSDGPLYRLGHYVYVIHHATEDTFLIQAIDAEGVMVFELDEKMSRPAQRHDLICYDEPAAVDDQVRLFVAWSLKVMSDYYVEHRSVAATWEDLMLPHQSPQNRAWPLKDREFHWFIGKHRSRDPRGLPPAGTGPVWKPFGSLYSYRIILRGEHRYEIRSENSSGLGDYRGTNSDAKPVKIEAP